MSERASHLIIGGVDLEIWDTVARNGIGAPAVAGTVAAMTDTSKVYVYTGSESGYTAGNWYYYNGSAWVSGGVYNSNAIGDGSITDAKLIQTGGVLSEVHDIRDGADGTTYASAGAAVRGQIKQITEKLTFINVETKNFWNEADMVDGYVSTNGNRNTTSTSYKTLSQAIPVSKDDVVRFYGVNSSDNFGGVKARFICAYDSNGNAVSASGVSADTYSYTVPEGIVAIIPSLYASIHDWMVTINYEATVYEAYQAPSSYYVAGKGFLPETIRDQIHINATDTEAQILAKLVEAYTNGNCDVIFDRSHYTFGTALSQIKNTYSLQNNEIPIGNGCHYYFNGATLEAIIDLQTLGEDFYCDLMGCQSAPSSFELHDGILIATDTRYVVHDESAAKVGSYKHLYDNMVLEYRTEDRTEAIRKCVGGGTGASGVVEMVGCKFITDGTDSCVSFHGNSTDVVGAEFNLNVRNCWFSNSLRAGALSEHQTAKLFYVGNSSGAALQNYDWDLTSFGNEVRT